MIEGKVFPVLWQGSGDYRKKLAALGCPRTVPWDFVVHHRDGCLSNHDQTPERLAERGGLAPAEIVAIVKGSENWATRKRYWSLTPEEEVAQLKELLAAWEGRAR